MRLAEIRKAVWYLCGGLLVLSGSIYTYLTPDADSDRPGQAETAGLAGGQANVEARAFSLDSQHGRSVFSPVSPSSRREPDGRFVPSQAGVPAPRVTGVDAAELLVRRNPARILPSAEGTIAHEPVPAPRGASAHVFPVTEVRNEARFARDLSRLERGYQSTMGDLFDQRMAAYGSYFGNPFHDALPDGEPTGGDNNNNGGNNNNGNGNNNNGNNGNNGGGNGGGDQNGNGQQPPPSDGGASNPQPRFSFLLIGDFQDAVSNAHLFRAYHNGAEFVAADGSHITDPLIGTVSGEKPVVFKHGESILAEDVDGDGDTDLFVSSPGPQGSGVKIFLRQSSGGYTLEVETYFLWQAISSLALFDFDGDQQLEVAALFRGRPNLFIFEIDSHELKYLKEIVLPFQPSVVVDSLFEGGVRRRWLHVFDGSFRRVASLTAQNPSIFLVGLGSLFGRISTCKLDAEVGGPEEVELTIFEAGGRISVFEKKGQSWMSRGSFPIDERYPLVLFGDYLDEGSRQLFWVR